MKKAILFALAVLAFAVVAQVSGQNAAEPYHYIKDIKIGGGTGFDYLTVDVVGRRLYIGHGQQVEVVDIDKDVHVGAIMPTPGVHGFAVAADLGKGFTSNGRGAGGNSSSIVDLKTLMITSTVPTGANPDAIMYEPKRQEVYALNHNPPGSATVISAKTGMVVTTIPLAGTVESGVADTAAGRVYVNIEDLNNVMVIDSDKHAVVGTWKIADGCTPTGIAIDTARHHLIIGCSSSMTIMDSTNGKVLQSLPSGGGVDAAAFDPVTGYAFVSSGRGGNVLIAKADASGKYAPVQTLATIAQARTMALDPKTHRIYVVGSETAVPAQPGGRGQAVPNSFKVLVYGMGADK